MIPEKIEIKKRCGRCEFKISPFLGMKIVLEELVVRESVNTVTEPQS